MGYISVLSNSKVEAKIPDKEWTTCSINRLFKKYRDTGTVDRRQGSSRPRSARTDENIDKVNDMVLTQEGQPHTHITVRAKSRETGIPVRKNLQLEHFLKQQIWTSNFPR